MLSKVQRKTSRVEKEGLSELGGIELAYTPWDQVTDALTKGLTPASHGKSWDAAYAALAEGACWSCSTGCVC